MKLFSKVLCLLLVVCMAGTLLASCNKPADISASSDASTPEGSGEDENQFRLPKEDFGGVTIKFLTDKATDYLSCEVAPTTLNDEPVNDAAYNRAALLSQEYGINLVQEYAENQHDVMTKAKEQAQSGLDTYQVFVAGALYLANAAVEDTFIDMNHIESNDFIDFTQPYWDQKMISDLTINDRVYFATGDALVTDDESTWAIFFNKDIANDNQIAAAYGVDSVYDLVETNQWTIDVLYEIIRGVTTQVGSEMTFAADTDDTWGMVHSATTPTPSWLPPVNP